MNQPELDARDHDGSGEKMPIVLLGGPCDDTARGYTVAPEVRHRPVMPSVRTPDGSVAQAIYRLAFDEPIGGSYVYLFDEVCGFLQQRLPLSEQKGIMAYHCDVYAKRAYYMRQELKREQREEREAEERRAALAAEQTREEDEEDLELTEDMLRQFEREALGLRRKAGAQPEPESPRSTKRQEYLKKNSETDGRGAGGDRCEESAADEGALDNGATHDSTDEDQ